MVKDLPRIGVAKPLRQYRGPIMQTGSGHELAAHRRGKAITAVPRFSRRSFMSISKTCRASAWQSPHGSTADR
jgi:hypothetical protein